jgi:hypothetical protein
MNEAPTIGTKFTYSDPRLQHCLYTIVAITATRVIYNDGKKSSCGPSNRKQLNHWLTIKGFNQRVQTGDYIIL